MLMAETINAVPWGADNAQTAHQIWGGIRVAAEAAVKHHLERLAEYRTIRRSEYVNADGKIIALYWREP